MPTLIPQNGRIFNRVKKINIFSHPKVLERRNTQAWNGIKPSLREKANIKFLEIRSDGDIKLKSKLHLVFPMARQKKIKIVLMALAEK